MVQIDEKLITYLEELSCLVLSEEEKLRLTEDLQKILENMAQLETLSTEGVAECSHPFGNVNAFRDDEIKISLERELILKNAPVKNTEMFIAPQTVE